MIVDSEAGKRLCSYLGVDDSTVVEGSLIVTLEDGFAKVRFTGMASLTQAEFLEVLNDGPAEPIEAHGALAVVDDAP